MINETFKIRRGETVPPTVHTFPIEGIWHCHVIAGEGCNLLQVVTASVSKKRAVQKARKAWAVINEIV